MRYVAAYLLAVLGGNANPNAAQIEKILSSVGVDVEADKVKKVLEQLKDKNVEELIAEGQEKLATVPCGGGGAAAAAPAADAGADDAGKKDEKPAKKEEPESESDDDMGFGLFD